MIQIRFITNRHPSHTPDIRLSAILDDTYVEMAAWSRDCTGEERRAVLRNGIPAAPPLYDVSLLTTSDTNWRTHIPIEALRP